ncbi:creatininase family protein [Actinacidiphila guanduensis]|uniref:Creatinine amidohydrolase n=1 Tax=Actinacidiphila guanduensis TaxID=310781 RepID=A0A1H0NC28_9ACTN|nr:creatininase family protein [Actinacidiphila guanduensis]SDO90309.1 creatinine amidohydrolase [Actinacidiphila guanduensis]
MTTQNSPTTAPRSHRLGELTWPEIRDRLAVAPVAIVPLGACEQHGYGMAQRTDTTRAEVVADMVAERLSPAVVVAPAIPVGVSEHHMGFPGTLTLTADTLSRVIDELVTALYRHGWRRVFVLTGHGGNNAAVEVSVARLRALLPDLHLAWSGVTPVASDVAAKIATSRVRGHSCEIETSQAMFADPSLVLPERLTRGSAALEDLDPAGRLSRSHPGIHFPQAYHALSATGTLGDATAATAENGAAIITTVVDRIAAFLEGFIALPDRAPAPTAPPSPYASPYASSAASPSSLPSPQLPSPQPPSPHPHVPDARPLENR